MKPYMIGIAGGSGSGKTTLIKNIQSRFGADQVSIVSSDDYYKNREDQKIDNSGVRNFDRPQSIDKKELLNDLIKLKDGSTIKRKEYTFNNPNAKPSFKITYPAPILLIEGLFVFHYKKIRSLLDLLLFIEATDDLKLSRRIRRDRIERNYPLDDVLYRYEHHVMPAYHKYIKPYKDLADLVINNNTNMERASSVVYGFISHQLAQKD